MYILVQTKIERVRMLINSKKAFAFLSDYRRRNWHELSP